ncbi:MAG TPA: DNA polymerase III subunit gamma/tau, partial [Thermoanaerobaculia bacterium]|nr:DNA polymerase III subunit gamma/tau [Thermoanaerobaculia bacterium]
PQNFSSLVGQEPIVTALRNALAEGRIAHAYLFSGIRGVGKTTAARVLAKALNCERGPAPDPCNECTPCVEIARGSDLDVLEVDAATYSKVEQVRELTESLRYGPARDRYKVVVLDEVHRLSRQAFDALLKIVEEPPPYLVFIFATTEIEAVPATILSRCQEFQFRRVTAPAVAALLRQICGSESIQASDSALRLVARAGEGSVRDAVALLDQLATFGSGVISDEAAVRLLGGLDIALFRRLLEAILQGEPAAVSREVRHVEDEGWDPRHVYGQFLAYCRDALHLALGSEPEQVDLVLEDAQALAALARAGGYENLLRLLNQLLASEPMVRRTETGALAIEIAWLRAAELPKLVRVEQLLAGQAGGAHAIALSRPAAPPARTTLEGTRAGHLSPTAATASTAPAAPTATAPPPSTRAAQPQTAQPTAAPRPMSPFDSADPSHPAGSADTDAAAPAGGGDGGGTAGNGALAPAAAARPTLAAGTTHAAHTADVAKVAATTSTTNTANTADTAAAAFLEEVAARKQALAAHLEQGAAIRFEAGRLLILLAPGDAYLSTRLRQPANREAIAAAAVKVWGPGTAWDIAEDATPPGPRAGAAAAAASPAAAATGDPPAPPLPADVAAAAMNPAIQTMLDIFGGKVVAVEEHLDSREE